MHQSLGYLIGYCSLPIAEPLKDRANFISQQIGGNLFEEYKRSVVMPEEVLENKNLFTPTYYYLWGKYDVCAIAEIDDLEFATRFFRPFNPLGDQHGTDLKNFDYKVLTAINPTSGGVKDRKLPYIAITQLKINSAFLIGNGLSLISAIVKLIGSHIDEISVRQRSSDCVPIEMSYKICECYSYHELIIIQHSNSFDFLRDAITKIRSLELAHLDELTYKEILANSVFEYLADKGENLEKEGIITNHLFESSLTTFGSHSDLYDKRETGGWDGVKEINCEELTFVSKWNIKPGHFKVVRESLKRQSPDDKMYMVSGKGDLLLIHKVSIHGGTLTDDAISNLFFPGNRFIADQSLHNHVIETYTTLSFDADTNLENSEINILTHHEIHKKLEKFLIPSEEIKKVQLAMKRLRLPKVLSEKVLKLISNYNNAVLNPDMYASYVELYFFITRNFVKTIFDFSNNSFDFLHEKEYPTYKLIETLNMACECLEMSFHNRFFQSYWTSEVLEVNTDYSGGLQNLISAYDACFKVINNSMMPKNLNSSFVFVKSDHKVSSTPNAMRLNYLHLTQPYIFCAIAVHETVNYIFEKWFYNDRYVQDDNSSETESTLIDVLLLLRQAGIKFRSTYLSPHIKAEVAKGELLLDKPLKKLQDELAMLNFKFEKLLKESTFRYFLTDYINYYYGYKGDFDLFCKTSWHYFIQLGNVYEKLDNLNPVSFCTMAIRLSLVRRLANCEEKEVYPSEILPFLEKSIAVYGAEVKFLINRLVENEAFSGWFAKWIDIIEQDKYNLMPAKTPMSEGESEVYQAIDNYLLNYEDCSDKEMTSKLNSFYKNQTDDHSTLLFPIYRHILLSYLKFSSPGIEILTKGTIHARPYVIRPLSTSGEKLNLYIDPSGGTFVIGEQNRKKYFLIRIKFIRLFFHLSMLQKKGYMSQILK